PIIDLMKTYNMPLHITGISLGAMVVPTLVNEKPGVFTTAASVCGQVDGTEKTQIFAAISKIPSIHYYDPADVTIAYGYQSIKEMCDQLKASGSDITLVTLKGSPSAHIIWPQAYATTQYWQWLSLKTTTTTPEVSIDKQYRIGEDMFIE